VSIAPTAVLRQLEDGARQLAQCVGYVGAATVEYLYSMETQEVYFLELNPRLQVGHLPHRLRWVHPWYTQSACRWATDLALTPGLPLGHPDCLQVAQLLGLYPGVPYTVLFNVIPVHSTGIH